MVKEILEPYKGKKPFSFRGIIFKPSDVADIQISATPSKIADLTPPMFDFPFGGTDVTDEFLRKVKKTGSENGVDFLSKDVFIVHGTDHTSLKELKTLLEEAGLHPIVLYEQPSKGMTLIEKLEEYSNVGFAFIILTPDDLCLSKAELVRFFSPIMKKQEPTVDEIKEYLITADQKTVMYSLIEAFDRLKDRARQNVVLEFGYFIGKLGRDRVCCLYTGSIELPSDMHGICYVHFDNSINEVRETILKELEAVGFEFES
jgi:predicted nucleotide-binding protein